MDGSPTPTPANAISLTPVPDPSALPTLTNTSPSPTPNQFPNPTSQPGLPTQNPSPGPGNNPSPTAVPNYTTIYIYPTSPPTPTPSRTPIIGAVVNSYNSLIKSPLSYLFQDSSGSVNYENSPLISQRSSLFLIFLAIFLIVTSLIVMKYMKNTVGKYGYFALAVGIILILGVVYLNSPNRFKTRNYSSYTLLTSSWQKYKERFIKPEGRVEDRSQNELTTSEAQSYAMLQAVWIDDKKTFDQVWYWTNINLKHKTDALFGWRYGKLENGSSGLLPGGGNNSATDADSDIGLALILASRRWHNPQYLSNALPILNDIWNKEVGTANSTNFLVAGNWAISDTELIVNPSYFAPYTWRIFSKADTKHDWLSLIDPAYSLLSDAGKSNLDKGKTVGLPPDWLSLDRKTGTVKPADVAHLNTDYSFDAMRIPWRIALDYQWNSDKKALDYLNSLNFIRNDYASDNKLALGYSHDGNPLSPGESPVMYATSLGLFLYTEPDQAKNIFQDKVLNLYSTDSNSFRQDLSYYEENWLWFGSALYLKQLNQF